MGADRAQQPQIDALRSAASSRAVPLEVLRIADPAIAARYEAPLVLARPDQHVAWRGDRQPDDPAALIDRVRGASAIA